MVLFLCLIQQHQAQSSQHHQQQQQSSATSVRQTSHQGNSTTQQISFLGYQASVESSLGQPPTFTITVPGSVSLLYFLLNFYVNIWVTKLCKTVVMFLWWVTLDGFSNESVESNVYCGIFARGVNYGEKFQCILDSELFGLRKNVSGIFLTHPR